MRRLLIATLAAAGAVACLPAAAQFQKPEDAIKYRQSALSVMGTHFGRIAGMAAGRIPFDAKVAADNADIVVTMSKLPYVAFIDGTDKGNTKAKPEIWTERDKFNAAAAKMQDEVVKLAAATKTGNLDQIKVAVGATGESCKACHDNYRAK